MAHNASEQHVKGRGGHDQGVAQSRLCIAKNAFLDFQERGRGVAERAPGPRNVMRVESTANFGSCDGGREERDELLASDTSCA